MCPYLENVLYKLNPRLRSVRLMFEECPRMVGVIVQHEFIIKDFILYSSQHYQVWSITELQIIVEAVCYLAL